MVDSVIGKDSLFYNCTRTLKMKKLILIIAATLFASGLLIGADQTQPNPFEKYDKEIKKLEEKKAKAKDDKVKKNVDKEIKNVEDQEDKALKKLTAPIEKEKAALTADMEKAKAKDKNADLSAKQARLDYLDKKTQYYNDLADGKTAEMPKDPSKEPAAKDKAAAVTAADETPDKKTDGATEKAE